MAMGWCWLRQEDCLECVAKTKDPTSQIWKSPINTGFTKSSNSNDAVSKVYIIFFSRFICKPCLDTQWTVNLRDELQLSLWAFYELFLCQRGKQFSAALYTCKSHVFTGSVEECFFNIMLCVNVLFFNKRNESFRCYSALHNVKKHDEDNALFIFILTVTKLTIKLILLRYFLTLSF